MLTSRRYNLLPNLWSCGVITIWMMYVLAASAASGTFLAAGWRSKHAPQGWHGLMNDPLWNEPEIDTASSETLSDLGAAIRLAVKRLAPVMANRSVQAEIAFPSGLLVRMRSAALVDLLEELLAAAIHGAPASRILMAATPRGDGIEVSITDDMAWADPDLREGRFRGLIERVAMLGGKLDINVHPAQGMTSTLRLTAATNERPDQQGPLKPEAANTPSGLAIGLSVPMRR